MMAIAGYTQKKVETVARQSTTDALATEIAGMVKFVHEDEILTDAQNSIKNPYMIQQVMLFMRNEREIRKSMMM
jgi:hypothetical protein